MNYYVRKYVINAEGLAYGQKVSFTTADTRQEIHITSVADAEEYTALANGLQAINLQRLSPLRL